MKHMIMKSMLWFWIFILCPLAYSAACPAGQTKDEAALNQIEHSWAQALEKHDTAALDCILAKEFEDAGPDGKLTDRATTLSKVASHRAVRNELTEMHGHVIGDFGYIRGLATATDLKGQIVAKVRFTDIYVYRDGRWQALAGHESLVADGAH